MRYAYTIGLTMVATMVASPVLAGNCPGENVNSPQLPAITRLEYTLPGDTVHRLPAVSANPVDHRKLVGASLRDGQLGIVLTLAQPVPAGCRVYVQIADPGATDGDLEIGRGMEVVKQAFDTLSYNFNVATSVAGNGGNTLVLSLPVRARVSDDRRFGLQLRLDTSRVRQTPSNFQPFEFTVMPFRLVSLTAQQAEMSAGARVDVFATLNEAPDQGMGREVTVVYTTSSPAAGLIDTAELAAPHPAVMVQTTVDGGEGTPRDRVVFMAAQRPLVPQNGILVDARTALTARLQMGRSASAQQGPLSSLDLTVRDAAVKTIAVIGVAPKGVTPAQPPETPVLPGIVAKTKGN